MFSFNLVDEKWIPRIMPDGSRQERSLIEVLLKAGEIKEIFDSSPLATVALHRLLLAILHCNFGPANKEEWQEIWNRGRFDEGRLLNYFHHWHGRFDLFDERYPFYQSASVPFSGSNSKGKLESYENSIASLAHELAIYLDKATLFDHTTESSSPTMSSSEAARLLLAFQSFALGKLSSKPRLKGEESAKAAPLVKGAVCLVQGNNLFETLMLNLHCYNRDDAEPFDMDKDDAPAWERNEETLTQDCFPKGYLDLLTWQSRRVKLHPEQGEDGQVVVRQVVMMKGNQFPGEYFLHQKEPMLAFYKRKNAPKGQDPWPPLAFQEDKALWRDSLTLFQSVEDNRTRPKMLTWLHDLSINGVIPLSTTYNLAIMGLVTNQAKIALWRHERLPLPLAYLEDKNLIDSLKKALEAAENVGRLFGPGFIEISVKGKKLTLPLPMRVLAQELLPRDQKGQVDKEAINSFVSSLAPARSYWAKLGVSFNQLVAHLAKDKTEVQGETVYGEQALPWWAGEVREAAEQAFREATNSLDRSGRMLKAVTLAEDNFSLRLNTLIKKFLEPYQRSEKKGGESA